MTQPPIMSVAQLESAREEVIQTLSAHFAEDHLTVEELEARIERAYGATSGPALVELVAGLPPLSAAEPAPVGLQLSGGRGDQKTIIALMGGVVRRGVWTVPRRVNAVALMGGIELDLREVRLAPGVTHIRALAVMGGVVVRVPTGIRVESDGFAIMGGFEDQLDQPAAADPNVPLVRVTGLAVMGGVEVKVETRGPGAAGADQIVSDADSVVRGKLPSQGG